MCNRRRVANAPLVAGISHTPLQLPVTCGGTCMRPLKQAAMTAIAFASTLAFGFALNTASADVRTASDQELLWVAAADAQLVKEAYCQSSNDGCWKCHSAPKDETWSWDCDGGWSFATCSSTGTSEGDCWQEIPTNCGEKRKWTNTTNCTGTFTSAGNCTVGSAYYHCWNAP